MLIFYVIEIIVVLLFVVYAIEVVYEYILGLCENMGIKTEYYMYVYVWMHVWKYAAKIFITTDLFCHQSCRLNVFGLYRNRCFVYMNFVFFFCTNSVTQLFGKSAENAHENEEGMPHVLQCADVWVDGKWTQPFQTYEGRLVI